jgi:hypothetical protein
MVGLALDVKAVLAEALLDLDPSQVSTTFRRDHDILDGFETGDVFRKISEDDKLFDPHPEYGQPISLCLTIRSDETTCNTSRTSSRHLDTERKSPSLQDAFPWICSDSQTIFGSNST